MAARKNKSRSRKKTRTKKPIEHYQHGDKKRANNPPVGLVTPATDPPENQTRVYAYDPRST